MIFQLYTFWFWILLTTTILPITYFINRNEENDGSRATFLLVLSTILFFALGNIKLFFEILDFISLNPTTILLYVIPYLILGIIWSFIKWYLFLLSEKKRYLLEKDTYKNRELIIPQATNYKSDITMWIFYWIFSLLFTLFHDWVYYIWKRIRLRLDFFYNKISEKVFKDLNK